MNALLRNQPADERELHPIFAGICASIVSAPAVIARATVAEPDPCESCEEQQAHYLDNRLCCKCARQARRDYEADSQ